MIQKPNQLGFSLLSHMVQVNGDGDFRPHGASLETIPDPNLPRLDGPSGTPKDVDREEPQGI